MTDARTWLDQVDARTNAAKAGPWYRQDGNAIPGPRGMGEPEWFIDSDPTLITYEVPKKADAEFIAHARTDLPAMSTALRAVLDLHAFVPVRPGIHSHKCRACQTPYPCPTVRDVTTALEDA